MTGTEGKLQVLQKHYNALDRMSEDSEFDSEWKEQVETKVSICSSLSCEYQYLKRELCKMEIEKCICNLKNNKTGGRDGLVGKWVKYERVGMVDLLHQHFKVVWQEETVSKQWREGLILNLFKKGDKKDLGKYMGITLLSVVRKVFCQVHNNRLAQYLDYGDKLHEGQAEYRVGRSCMNIVSVRLINGRQVNEKIW